MRIQKTKRWIALVVICAAFVGVLFVGPVNDHIEYAASSAACSGNLLKLRVTRLLGVDIHKPVPGRGPLIVSAAWNGQKEIIRYLMAEGVDVETKDKFGGTALSRAAQMGQIETVRMLLEAKADVNVQDLEGGNTSIDLCRMNASTKGFDSKPIVNLIASFDGKAKTTKNEGEAAGDYRLEDKAKSQR